MFGRTLMIVRNTASDFFIRRRAHSLFREGLAVGHSGHACTKDELGGSKWTGHEY
jgi:hypothetical protein